MDTYLLPPPSASRFTSQPATQNVRSICDFTWMENGSRRSFMISTVTKQLGYVLPIVGRRRRRSGLSSLHLSTRQVSTYCPIHCLQSFVFYFDPHEFISSFYCVDDDAYLDKMLLTDRATKIGEIKLTVNRIVNLDISHEKIPLPKNPTSSAKGVEETIPKTSKLHEKMMKGATTHHQIS